MKLYELTTYRNPKYLFTEHGRNLITHHIEYLRQHPDTELIEISSDDAYVHYYSLDSFLMSMGYDPKQVYPTLLINSLYSNESFNKDIKKLYIPSIATIEDIITVANV